MSVVIAVVNYTTYIIDIGIDGMTNINTPGTLAIAIAAAVITVIVILNVIVAISIIVANIINPSRDRADGPCSRGCGGRFAVEASLNTHACDGVRRRVCKL